MLMALPIILSAVFGGWLAWRAIKGKPIKVHLVMYGFSTITGIYSLVFFMTMNIPQTVKVVVAVVVGVVLIFWAARLQRRGQQSQP